MTAKARIGDSVLIRCKVIPTTEGSTANLYPGVLLAHGHPKAKLDQLDIVSVEQDFRKGDRVRWDSIKLGTIVALSPPDIAPAQAWIEEFGRHGLTTENIRRLTREEE